MGNQMRGARDIVWYVKADSPIRTLKDADGKTVSYSRVGSATHIVVTALADRYGIKPKYVGTGSIPATRTQVTDQIDVGWGNASQLVDMFRSGQARIIARGAELADYNNVTLRAVSANADFVRQQPKVAKAFDADSRNKSIGSTPTSRSRSRSSARNSTCRSRPCANA